MIRWPALVLLAAACAVVAGFVAPPRHAEGRPFPPVEGSWELNGFAAGAVFPADAPGVPAGVASWGSRVGARDDSTGTLRSPWFQVQPGFVVLVAGNARAPGNSLTLEARAGGERLVLPAPEQPTERWTAWRPTGLPAGAQIRLVATDAAIGPGGWLGVSEPFSDEMSLAAGLVALLRLSGALALSLTLTLGPGLAWRAWSGRALPAALLGLPGLLITAAAGALCWLLARRVSPHLTAAGTLVPVLLACAAVWWRRGFTLDATEQRALKLYALVVILAVARATWSQGPKDELYGGTISRTLESGDRSDARIPYHVVQLVAHGTTPYSARGRSYFDPWTFSHRGPLAGLFAAPVAFLTGARVPLEMPDLPWQPFDPEGFAAYRIALIALAALALFAVLDLAGALAGPRAATVATVLAAGTPFVVHEAWFTWPKLLAAAWVLAAFREAFEGRPVRSGLLVGLGYLCHPGALLGVPAALLLGAVQQAGGAQARLMAALALLPTRKLWAGAALFVAGLLLPLLFWRVVNGSHFKQDGFMNYLRLSAGHGATGLADWAAGRWTSLANTVVPMLGYFDYRRSGLFTARSDAFLFQYWCTAPVGLGLLALPVFARQLYRAARWSPLLFASLVLIPLVAFALYWGAFTQGMMREGLHSWALSVVILCSCALPLRRWELALLAARAAEIFAMAVLRGTLTGAPLLAAATRWTDGGCLLLIAATCAALAWETWSLRKVIDGTSPGRSAPARGTMERSAALPRSRLADR